MFGYVLFHPISLHFSVLRPEFPCIYQLMQVSESQESLQGRIAAMRCWISIQHQSICSLPTFGICWAHDCDVKSETHKSEAPMPLCSWPQHWGAYSRQWIEERSRNLTGKLSALLLSNFLRPSRPQNAMGHRNNRSIPRRNTLTAHRVRKFWKTCMKNIKVSQVYSLVPMRCFKQPGHPMSEH